MLKLPVSGISNVESMRTSVDFPEPLAPRVPTISHRLILRLTLSIARTSSFCCLCSLCSLPDQRSNRRDFLNTFETPSMTIASFEASMTRFSKRGVCIVMFSTDMYSLLLKKRNKKPWDWIVFCQSPRLREFFIYHTDGLPLEMGTLAP